MSFLCGNVPGAGRTEARGTRPSSLPGVSVPARVRAYMPQSVGDRRARRRRDHSRRGRYVSLYASSA